MENITITKKIMRNSWRNVAKYWNNSLTWREKEQRQIMAMYQIECYIYRHIQEISGQIMKIISVFWESLSSGEQWRNKGYLLKRLFRVTEHQQWRYLWRYGRKLRRRLQPFLHQERIWKILPDLRIKMLKEICRKIFMSDVCEKMNQAVCRYGTEHLAPWVWKHNGNAPLYTRVYVLPAILGTAGYLWMAVSFNEFLNHVCFWWYSSWEKLVNPVSWTSERAADWNLLWWNRETGGDTDIFCVRMGNRYAFGQWDRGDSVWDIKSRNHVKWSS